MIKEAEAEAVAVAEVDSAVAVMAAEGMETVEDTKAEDVAEDVDMDMIPAEAVVEAEEEAVGLKNIKTYHQ